MNRDNEPGRITVTESPEHTRDDPTRLEVLLEQERLKESLKLSRSIQMSMLPTVFPRFARGNPVDLHACMEPAREVSGDFYDFFYLDAHTLLLVIADVSDKGMPAALFMVMVKTLIRAYARTYRLPHRILAAVNPELCRDNEALMFVTLFVATLDTGTGLLVYSSAGHPPPLILGRNGTVEVLTVETSTPLGITPAMHFEAQERVLHPGEGLLLYTDGISEAMNAEQDTFGETRLMALFENQTERDAEQVVNTVLEAVRTFRAAAEPSDDLTLLFVRQGDSG